jgi:hypothetical protein
MILIEVIAEHTWGILKEIIKFTCLLEIVTEKKIKDVF